MAGRNQRVFCVLNPARRHSDRVWPLLQHHCAALGYPTPTLLTTTVEAAGGPQARDAINRGADLVIVAGGDGTIRNVSNVIAHTGIPLGIVPIGTANIFHLNVIGKDKRLDQAVRTALLGPDITVDSGRVHLQLSDGQHWDDRFLVVVGVGRDALSLGGVSDRLKRSIGAGAYFAAGVMQLLRSPLPMQVEIDNRPLPHRAAWSVLVGNCGMVPGKITILPGANLQDGKLNLLHVAPGGLAGWIPIALRGLRGSAGTVRGVADHLVEEVTIIPEQPAAVQIDGDVWNDTLRIEIAIDPGSLVIRGKETHEPAGDGGEDSQTEAGLHRQA